MFMYALLVYGAVVVLADPVYVSGPGVVRSYQGESATFVWTLDTPLGDINWLSITFYYENTDQSIYSRVTGTSGSWAPDYENRANATFPEDDVSLGFTLYRIDEGDINYPYECGMQLFDGSKISNNTATLFIFGTPTTPTLTPAPPDAVENTEFSLTCSTTTTSVPAGLLPVMTYTWTRDGGTLPADRHSTRGDHGQELVIHTVQREDHHQVYRCQVRETGSKLSNYNQLTLDVQYGPDGISLSDPGPITVEEGNNVTVTCTSDCRPGCDYVWTGPGGYRHEGPNLSFQSINRDRHGNYTCQSSNDHGSNSTQLSVTLNFAPAITSFGHSQGDISRGDDVTLTCSVDSRPDSVIQISNSTSELDPTIRGNTAEYRFPQPVTVLDSGSYFCSASNLIEPNPDDQQLTLDVKGGFLPCNNQSVNETSGAALNSPFEETICQIGNPFPVISKDDWMFLPSNDTRTAITLPDDVYITMDSTAHVYQNIIVFRIQSVSVSHYGTYTMTADNGEGQSLVFTLLITPDGLPEAPTHLKCTDTTAVSLHLQWNAGHDGGADQAFVLTYTDKETGTANVVEIDGSETPRGALVSHRLADTQHILPDTTYLIRLDARNKNGKTNGSAITNSTLAQPGFVGDPTIVIEADTALVTWPISNPESVTHILVQVCDSGTISICNATTVSDVSIQPYVVALPDASSFQFTFELYDGEEIVNNVTHPHDTGTGDNTAFPTAIVIGCVVGVSLAVILIAVLIVLWRKGIIPQDKPPQPENMTGATSNGHDTGHDNPTISDVDTEMSPYSTSSVAVVVDDISPYGSTPATRLRPVDNIDPYGTSADHTINEYADVKKAHKKPKEDVYSEVRKDRHTPHVMPRPIVSDDTGESLGAVPRPVSVYPPTKAPKPTGRPEPAVYADVNKKRNEAKLLPSTKGKPAKKQNITATGNQSGNTNENPYTNVAASSTPEGPYSNVCIPGVSAVKVDGNAYQNFNDLRADTDELLKPFVGDDGITYARLDMTVQAQAAAREAAARGIPPPRPIIRGEENKVEYASIDQLKTSQQAQ